MTLLSIEEAEAALQPYVPLVSQYEAGTTLERVWPLMELIGNPQEKLKIIHIAGTSGKTSTAYYLSALLAATGKKAGLTVSPHVDSITERVQINGSPLSETDFCNELGEFLATVQRAGQKPSYFELLYAFALSVFAKQDVDYAVVETGMGGLLDATNVARRPDKICVITDIGFDHTHLLGKTLAEITAQKVGIVHPDSQLFMYRQAEEIMTVVEQAVEENQANLHIVTLPKRFDTSMAEYQKRNWWLAYQVFEYLIRRDELGHLTSRQLIETRNIVIPGRMQTVSINDKTIIMDGAHNAQKVEAFINSFRQLYPAARPAVLIGLKRDKEYEAVTKLIAPLASRVITTAFKTSQDLPVQSLNPDELAEAFEKAGAKVNSIADQRAALGALLSAPERVVIITGSFYLLSQIRTDDRLAPT